MASLATGVGLGAAGYLLAQPGLAASGTLVAAVGLYVERLQARSLRRRRRAERMRNRHEVTELRRTIAQLRLDVGAFQRALLDTGAVLAAQSLPLLTPVAEPAPRPLPRAEAPQPARAEVPEPARAEAPEPAPVEVAQPVALAVGEGWVQTRDRDAVDAAPLPARRLNPFISALSGSIPVAADEAPPARASFDTGGIPVLEPAPRDRLSVTSDALVYAALAELDDDEATRALAYAGSDQAERAARDDERAVPVRPRHTA